MVKARNKLVALSKNEEVGDIPTHFFKSGSSMRPKNDLMELNEFKGWDITVPCRVTLTTKGTPIYVMFRFLEDDANLELITGPTLDTLHAHTRILGGQG